MKRAEGAPLSLPLHRALALLLPVEYHLAPPSCCLLGVVQGSRLGGVAGEVPATPNTVTSFAGERPVMSKFLLSLIRPRAKDDDKSEERRYDPRCGMSREEFEWRWAHSDAVRQRMPPLLEKVDIGLKKMRPHFVNDPDALKHWEKYAENVRSSFRSDLYLTLVSPGCLPNSVAYKHLMQRKARSKTLVGRLSGVMEKLRQVIMRNKTSVRAGATVAVVAAAFALGLSIGQSQLHEVQKKIEDQ